MNTTMSDNPVSDVMQAFVQEHVEQYLSDPEAAHLKDFSPLGNPQSFPTLLLTTVGRKSGEERHSPLIYGRAGDAYVVIASKAGAPTNPAWYLNLESQPKCHVRVGADQFDAVARDADAADYDAIWQEMENLFPAYADYQASAQGRKIPVVLLERL